MSRIMIEAFDKLDAELRKERDDAMDAACTAEHQRSELEWMVNQMLPYIMDLPAFDDFICDMGAQVYVRLGNKLNCKPSEVPDIEVVRAFLEHQSQSQLKRREAAK